MRPSGMIGSLLSSMPAMRRTRERSSMCISTVIGRLCSTWFFSIMRSKLPRCEPSRTQPLPASSASRTRASPWTVTWKRSKSPLAM